MALCHAICGKNTAKQALLADRCPAQLLHWRRTMVSIHTASVATVEKTPSGVAGFDQITGGGLPKGRATLICGGPGSGKTIFAVEFLVRGAELGEPGVFVAFEESVDD